MTLAVPSEIRCKNCSKKLLARYLRPGSRKEFCSNKCANEHKGEKRACAICENDFAAKSTTQKTCSHRCSAMLKQRTKSQLYLTPDSTARYHIFKRDNFKCVYCGASAHNGTELQVDHIYPQYLGGKNDAFNLVSSCQRCNAQKSCSPFSEKKIMQLWNRNRQLDMKMGLVSSYDTLK